MRVLFVSSGNKGRVKPLVENQAISLKNQGLTVDHFLVNSSGLFGYLRNIIPLKKKLRSADYSVVHAHYSFSGFLAVLAGSKRLVVSLMGSDTYMGPVFRLLIRLCYLYLWRATIVKTPQMRDILKATRAYVIPNGIDDKTFIPIPKSEARKAINYPADRTLILFLADPARPEKNFKLAIDAVKCINRSEVDLVPIFDREPSSIPFYLNAADVLLLTSNYEGSVNAVKEAMACNTKIVSTDVGDVRVNLEKVNGSFVCANNKEDLAKGLVMALSFKDTVNSRTQLMRLGLDSGTTAKRLIQVYEKVAGQK